MASISDKLDGVIKEFNELIEESGGTPPKYTGGLTIMEHVEHLGKLIDSMPHPDADAAEYARQAAESASIAQGVEESIPDDYSELSDDVEELKKQLYYDADISGNVGLHYSWYYGNNVIMDSPTDDYVLSNRTRIYAPKGTTIKIASGYRYKYYLTEANGTIISATNSWINNNDTVINQDAYLLFSMVFNSSPSTPKTISELLANITISIPISGETNHLFVKSNDFSYSYTGSPLPINGGRYTMFPATFNTPSPASISVQSYQGFGYYNGVLIQFYSNNKAVLVDCSDNTMIATLSTETEHGNSIGWTDAFYDTNDEFPIAIVADGLTRTAYKVRIQRTAITVLQTIVFPDTAGYYVSTMVDPINNHVYTLAYSQNSYSSDANNNHMIIGKWDLSAMTDNGDNTVTPQFIESFTVPFILTTQGPCWNNGLLYVVSSHSSSPSTKVYVIDPITKCVRNVLTEFGYRVKTNECEGICFANIDGDTYAVIKPNSGDLKYYLLQFAN